WRLRTVGGYGEYSYTGTTRRGTTRVVTKHRGRKAFGDLLAGYQWQTGNLTLKAFAGGTGIGHIIAPSDPDNSAAGTSFGFTGSLEAWLNVSPRTFISANVSWASVFQTFKADVRGGYLVAPNLHLGLETGVIGNAEYEAANLGAFAQYRWRDMELRASTGISGDRDMQTGAYGTLNVLYTY
ncbi:MAG TPA: cellulose biosynthesis protein BcsS, partial [Hyphomicrobiaceae bacterium]|nr:cellulose biosynthesis protein BcsS [Hyphomicrobiaceae bacterium]